MNLDPLTSLALSMENNKGVYALLLGSGVSHAANIKTGWGIMTDLIMKIAHVQGATAEAEQDPVAWFTQTFNEDPGYSSLLEILEPTQATRSSLIAPCFERSAEDEENGDKLPTKAHRAIAQLVKAGYIKVILTTNFDRLMEQALEDASIQPTVIANSNDIPGAMPLVHERACTIVKLHGDYKDLYTKNTYGELETYDNTLKTYLDRILDDYGLIICGWSGEWDTALRNAILRCPNRRFQTYWISRGEPGDKAQEIIDHRKAQPIPTAGADALFVELEEKVRSIAEYRQVHPVTVQIASATVKRYLAEKKHRIKLHDFVMQEVDRFLEATKDRDILTGTGNDMVKRYLNLSEVLQHVFAVGGYWSKDGDIEVWEKALERILNNLKLSYHSKVSKILHRFIASTLMHSFCLGSLAAQKYQSTITLLKTLLLNSNYNKYNELINNDIKDLPGLKERNYKVARSLLIFRALSAPMSPYLQHSSNDHATHFTPYKKAFDKLEYFIDLIQFQHGKWCPIGLKIAEIEWQAEPGAVVNELSAELVEHQENWAPLKAGLSNGDFAEFMECHEKYAAYVDEKTWFQD